MQQPSAPMYPCTKVEWFDYGTWEGGGGGGGGQQANGYYCQQNNYQGYNTGNVGYYQGEMTNGMGGMQTMDMTPAQYNGCHGMAGAEEMYYQGNHDDNVEH